MGELGGLPAGKRLSAHCAAATPSPGRVVWHAACCALEPCVGCAACSVSSRGRGPLTQCQAACPSKPGRPAAPHAQALVVAHAEATAVLASLAEAANHGEEALQSLELSVLHEGTMMTARAVSLLAPNFADVVSDSWSAALSSQLSCLPEVSCSCCLVAKSNPGLQVLVAGGPS